MNKLYLNECELKFNMGDLSCIDDLVLRLEKNGYIKTEDHIETDFTPDTEDFACKKNNIIIRYRMMTSNINCYLLTLKIKKDNIKYQSNLEIEYFSDAFSHDKHEEINDILNRSIGKTIPQIKYVDLLTLLSNIYDAGFTKCRMLSQKHRITYKNNKTNSSVCFDRFPHKLGVFMELEAFDEMSLYEIVNLLKPDMKKLEKRNYGTLIQDLLEEKGIIETRRRICLFDEELEQEVYKKFRL